MVYTSRRISSYTCWILFICKGPTSFNWKYKPVRITQKEHLLIWNSETAQNYLYSYQTETAIFSSYKAWKSNYGIQLFKSLKNISFISNFWPAILLKWKYSSKFMEAQVVFVDIFAWTWTVEIVGVAVQKIHQNSKKWWLLWGIAWWKWPWGCFSQFLLFMTMVPMLQRQFRRLAQEHCWSYINSLKQLIL